jgi:citrate synthase
MNQEIQSGLEGVVAFATEIAEPDREGGTLRYRGVDSSRASSPARAPPAGRRTSSSRSASAG